MRNTERTKAIYRTTRVENSEYSRLKVVFYLIGILATLVVFIAASGVSYANSLLLCIALVIQWLPGAIIWAWSNKNRINSIAELVGMGLAVGTLLSLLSSQLFRTTSFQKFSWAIPCLVICLMHSWKLLRGSQYSYRPKSILDTRQKFLTFFPTLLLIVIQLSIWWRWHPIVWRGWWKFNIDIPFFDSYSNSIAILGTTQSLMNPELNLRYHWFTYAWVGSLGNSLNVDTFIVLTRILPIVVFCMAATITYAWTKDYSENFWTPIFASLVVTIGPGLSVGSYVMLRSPSLAMAGCWSLAFSLVLLRIVHGRFTGIGSYLLLGLFAAGVIGGKGSNLLIIGPGLIGLLLISLRQIRTVKIRIWVSATVSLVTFVGVYQKFISSSEPRSIGIGLFLGWPGLFLTILPTTIGIYGLYKNRTSHYQPLFIYSISVFIAGSLLSLFTHDPAGAQVYFIISAAVVCVVPSLIGMEKMKPIQWCSIWINLRSTKFKQIHVFAICFVLLGGFTATLIWTTFENSTESLAKVMRTIAPVPIFVAAFCIFLLVTWSLRLKKLKSNGGLKLLFASMLAISVVASTSGILNSIQSGPIYSGSPGLVGFGKSSKGIPGAISLNYVEAGNWVQENIKEKNLFFTNRQCINPLSSYKDCNGYWFYASALTKHQFLIEGAAISDFGDRDMLIMSKEQALSYRFSLTPNRDDLETLWASNVRWGWIDRQVSDVSDWEGLAVEIYSNPDIAIIELVNPKN